MRVQAGAIGQFPCPQWCDAHFQVVQTALFSRDAKDNPLLNQAIALYKCRLRRCDVPGCAQSSTEFSQVVHRLILCG